MSLMRAVKAADDGDVSLLKIVVHLGSEWGRRAANSSVM